MRERVIFSRHARDMLTERNISVDWVFRVLEQPALLENDPQRPDIKRAFRPIAENGNRVLRVVYSEKAGQMTVVTAFFDRRRKNIAT